MFRLVIGVAMLSTVVVPVNVFGQVSRSLSAMRQINPNQPQPIQIEKDRVAASSIRVVASDHLLLFTDVKGEPGIDELTRVFDAAVPLFCAYFGIASNKADDWQMRAMVMGEKKRFVAAGLFPQTLPPFPTGYQRGHEMWLYVQPGKYYTRHLLLHEGTHAFMQWFLGGVGAPWYSEGMAEMLALHSWEKGQLKMNLRLTDRRQAEYWGRIKIVKQDCRDNKVPSLEDVFAYTNAAFRNINSYAWSWAACEFLSNHELTQKPFSKLAGFADLPPDKFNARYKSAIRGARKEIDRDWQLFVRELDFAYDVRGSSFSQSKIIDSGQSYSIATNKSWQATSLTVSPGDQLQISASGRFTVAVEDENKWPCESNGITIAYYKGRPLGMLMAGILGQENQIEGLINAQPVDHNKSFVCKHAGTLCFRINEYPGHLQDNDGQLTVVIKKVQ